VTLNDGVTPELTPKV